LIQIKNVIIHLRQMGYFIKFMFVPMTTKQLARYYVGRYVTLWQVKILCAIKYNLKED
jgi:hypothetical protein